MCGSTRTHANWKIPAHAPPHANGNKQTPHPKRAHPRKRTPPLFPACSASHCFADGPARSLFPCHTPAFLLHRHTIAELKEHPPVARASPRQSVGVTDCAFCTFGSTESRPGTLSKSWPETCVRAGDGRGPEFMPSNDPGSCRHSSNWRFCVNTFGVTVASLHH